MTAWGMVVLGLSLKKTVCASSKASATECFDVARGPMAGTMVLAKPAGVVQLGFVVLENACAKGDRLYTTTTSDKVDTDFIAM